jgi:hypothetical protein
VAILPQDGNRTKIVFFEELTRRVSSVSTQKHQVSPFVDCQPVGLFEARDCACTVGRAWFGAACERHHLPAHDLAQPVVLTVDCGVHKE